MNRNRRIIRISAYNIAVNIFMSSLKLMIGVLSHSIAIVMDAINNLTDTLSSIITIVGTKLSEREPDMKHPFGYGRIEYLTALLISILITYVGFSAMRASFTRIFHPEICKYTPLALILIGLAVLVKVGMGNYIKKTGMALDSAALIATGRDAMNDSLASLLTLFSALISIFAGISIEAYVGLLISIVIIITGLRAMHSTVSSILGESIDIELITAVRNSIMSFPEVDDVYDIVIHNYGKEKLIGSANIEILDVYRASWVDNLQRAISKRVLQETGVELYGITICAVNTRESEAKTIQDSLRKLADENEQILGAFGFYLDRVDNSINFDLVTDSKVKDTKVLHDQILSTLSEWFPEYKINIVIKRDFSDRKTKKSK